jgi:hypothetical protein
MSCAVTHICHTCMSCLQLLLTALPILTPPRQVMAQLCASPLVTLTAQLTQAEHRRLWADLHVQPLPPALTWHAL